MQSGTTGIIAKRHKRKYIGIDLEKKFLDLTIKDLKMNKYYYMLSILTKNFENKKV